MAEGGVMTVIDATPAARLACMVAEKVDMELGWYMHDTKTLGRADALAEFFANGELPHTSRPIP
jgi:hypothetical protein